MSHPRTPAADAISDTISAPSISPWCRSGWSEATGQPNAWPATHRLLATLLVIMGCLFAATGCRWPPDAARTRTAVAPTYSYVHDTNVNDNLALWPLVPINSSVLIAGGVDGR